MKPSFRTSSKVRRIPESIDKFRQKHDYASGTDGMIIKINLDEETGELLKDPVGYAQNGHANMPHTRRSTNPSIPTSRFANLSLSTNVTSPPIQGYSNGTGGRMGLPTPASAMPPNMNGNSPFHYPNSPHIHA